MKWHDSGATYSPCGRYRYTLWRQWNDVPSPRTLVFICLNPSTATAEFNDPTVSRLEERARRLGYDRLVVLNVFAWRSTDPHVLPDLHDPIGPDNDEAILRETASAAMVICAWGNHAKLGNRSAYVESLLRRAGTQIYYLVMNGTGIPAHPLYKSYDLLPKLWEAK